MYHQLPGMAGFPENQLVAHLGVWVTWCQKKDAMVTAIGHGGGGESAWSRNTVS